MVAEPGRPGGFVSDASDDAVDGVLPPVVESVTPDAGTAKAGIGTRDCCSSEGSAAVDIVNGASGIRLEEPADGDASELFTMDT